MAEAAGLAAVGGEEDRCAEHDDAGHADREESASDDEESEITEDESDDDFWVAKSDSSPSERKESSDGVPRPPSMAAQLGTKLMREAGRFGGAAKSALLAETRSMVKDAQELAIGFKEGAQLTVQDTLDLKDQVVTATKARVAASNKSIIGLLAARKSLEMPAQQSGSESAAASLQEGDTGGQGHERSGSDGGISNTSNTSTVATLSPLRALSQGLAAQMGVSATVSGSPITSATSASATSNLEHSEMDLTLPRTREGSGDAPWPRSPTNDPDWALDYSCTLSEAARDATDVPRSRTPTDALERLLSGELDDDEDGAAAGQHQDSSDNADGSSSVESPTQPKAASASVASAVGQFARSLTSRLPRRVPSWKAQSGNAASEGAAVKESLSQRSSEADAEATAEALFLSLPSTRANYTEISTSNASPVVAEPPQSGSESERESPGKKSQRTSRLRQQMTEAAHRTQAASSGFFHQATSLPSKIAAAATRGRSQEPAADKLQGQSRSQDKRRSRCLGTESEDSIFAIGLDDDDDMFGSEEVSARRVSKFSEFQQFCDSPRLESVPEPTPTEDEAQHEHAEDRCNENEAAENDATEADQVAEPALAEIEAEPEHAEDTISEVVQKDAEDEVQAVKMDQASGANSISSAPQDESVAADADACAPQTVDDASPVVAQVSPDASSASATPQVAENEVSVAVGRLPETKATEVPDQNKRNSKERSGADVQMRSKLEKRRSKVEGQGRK